MRLPFRLLFAPLLLLVFQNAGSQTPPFYFGSDLSYVNEMEDCGVVFKENTQPTDPFEIFARHKTNLVRLRLWHTPAWLDTLNAGARYSDFDDVRRSILRAKAAGMQVLLNFHLSDGWADPSKQIVPKAWEPVVGNLPLLEDSLRNYISTTLLALAAEGLLPEMVQIGNETNRGILLSPADNAAGWQLDWPRNSRLFNTAIQAVRTVAASTGRPIKIALHVAGPADAGWLMDGFWQNGVRDFDVIGLSYYWAWHKPTTIADAGAVVAQLRTKYPGKEVMIFETGYPWTLESNDAAPNIINELHPAYSPASPSIQKKWLTDLTSEVIARGGKGVIYWEPAWVSSPCHTPWGEGSHQEHAAFFDFSNNVLLGGGMFWPEHPFPGISPTVQPQAGFDLKIMPDSQGVRLAFAGFPAGEVVEARLFDAAGGFLNFKKIQLPADGSGAVLWQLQDLAPGIYFATFFSKNGWQAVRKIGW